MRITAVIFDLDDTLYDENQYFAEVITAVCLRYSLNRERMLYMLNSHRFKRSRDIFGDLLRDQGQFTPELQEAMFSLYRTIDCNILLASDVRSLLTRLREADVRIALLTNGDVLAQRNKVRVLDIEGFVDHVVYARDQGKQYEKPSSLAFKRALSALRASPSETLFVGDNSYTDIYGASRVGLTTIWLNDGSMFCEGADFVIENLSELFPIMRSLHESNLNHDAVGEP